MYYIVCYFDVLHLDKVAREVPSHAELNVAKLCAERSALAVKECCLNG